MKNRVKETTSMTAAMTCSIRAASFFEKDPCLKADDDIAPLILPRLMQPLVKSRLIRRAFMRSLAPKGIFEYVIARTKYVDEAVGAALAAGIRQFVLLGAGYDSRAVRFHARAPEAVFFELDAPPTQEAKRAQFVRRGIALPPSCRFIPIDFNSESPREKLLEAGFRPDEKSFFILEGVLMYLKEAAVNETLKMMRSLMHRGGRAVCDFIYQSVLRKENLYFGEKGIYRRVNKFGEAWKSGIERNDIEAFFSQNGFTVAEVADAERLEHMYFTCGKRHRMNGTHCVVLLEG
jgi:methyltransferase (TIGR00027 family)